MKFGDNLKNIRKYKKISQEELAEKLGVSRQSISKWETGENYPSMTNIMCLCDIFNCKINELVHEEMEDIDSLDEEIKMNVVKFKKDEQRKMKGISKLIYIVARIAKCVAVVGLVIIAIASILFISITASSKIDTNNKELTVFNQKANYVVDNGKFTIKDDEEENVLINNLTEEEIDIINKALDLPKGIQITFVVTLSVSLVLSMLVAFKLSGYLEKLFKNIHDNDTPFNMDNVLYMKKIALYIFLYLICSDIMGSFANGITNLNMDIEIELTNYVIAAIVLAISYVFKYGYEIQLDSKGKIYGDINE